MTEVPERTVPQRMSVVTLAVSNVEELRDFYKALGWEELPSSHGDWVGFLAGGVVLALYPRAALSAETGAGMYGGGFTLAVNVDSPEQVDTAYEAALAVGAGAVAEPQERPWGGRSAYFADPEDNRWEIAYNETAVFGEHGEVVGFGAASE
ncbi:MULTISPECIES: VOC family protein [Prauserella salsuginis group]|uniref:VOC domain-containing protein n=2 Tax=Prauserella salsuginis group TaxID=2893672 RepID=A0A839XJX4_9PSEU|nr:MULTISPECIES: VOC family protein [Prauserella salsuginis group]MBB3662847.1 hypothetical protein [Prauserella sediminis]MCR3720544.1 hypothetical protein [Prauserella flava]MCR3733746.1 hypothetical protein [Prauserella salsuginis]